MFALPDYRTHTHAAPARCSLQPQAGTVATPACPIPQSLPTPCTPKPREPACDVQMQQRLADLGEAEVPVTNYGIFFSWAASPTALRRALEPWGLEPPAQVRR